MRPPYILPLLVAAACATSQRVPGDPDAGDDDPADARADAAPTGDALAPDAPPAADASTEPYRHTITIDGANDFAAADTFVTTSAPGYVAYVSWDDANLYVGYRGPDLDPAGPDTGYKWLFIYLDADPGASTGARNSLRYNTQRANFPTGFGAEYYLRWKCDASFSSLEEFQAPGWATATTPVQTARNGDFIELAVPRSLFAGATTVGVAAWMINEKPDVEGSFAGLYAGNFTDGYAAELPLTRYLEADFTSTAPPSDPSHAGP